MVGIFRKTQPPMPACTNSSEGSDPSQIRNQTQKNSQALVYIGRSRVAFVNLKPQRVWALIPQPIPMAVPIRIEPGANAYPLAEGKDWAWAGGRLRYVGKSMPDNTWFLMEYW